MDKKIVVNLIGGVGNQMFQYALGYAISRLNNLEFFVDLSAYDTYKVRNFELDKFNLHLNVAKPEDYKDLAKKHLFKKTFYKEKSMCFNPSLLKIKKSAYFRGFWQSERYFSNFREEIFQMFSFKNFDFIQNAGLLDKIKNTNAVSINLRLCEYITNKEVRKKHFVCTKKYYENALSLIKNKLQNPVFYVFSDDIEGAKEFLPEGENYIFANTLNWQEDLYFMQNCKHNIVANSSFSWWAAWLNKNKEKIVIAPNKWFSDEAKMDYRDIVPKTWIKVSVN